jgi:hypothetical protein
MLALQAKEQDLPWRKRFEMRIHLYYCRCCSNFVKQSDLMDKSLERFAHDLGDKPPFTADIDFKERMKAKLK